MNATNPTRLIVALSGASGAQYGVMLLRKLLVLGVETHLILSKWALRVLAAETDVTLDEISSLACFVYDNDDLAASVSSSSFLFHGMAIVPASVKTVAAVAHGDTGSLIARAADNALRMRRPLVVGLRETPLSLPCLENLAAIARAGGTVLPLCPGFYTRPSSLDALYEFMVTKVLDCLGIAHESAARWNGEA